MFTFLEKLLIKFHLDRFINRETISYLFWGVLTTLINVGLFQLLFAFGIDYRLANIVSIVIAIIFAYLANKLFVFRTRCATAKALLLEITRYAVARAFTMLIDYFGLVFLSDACSVPPAIGKWVTTVVVVILNYVLGKFGVFKKG